MYKAIISLKGEIVEERGPGEIGAPADLMSHAVQRYGSEVEWRLDDPENAAAPQFHEAWSIANKTWVVVRQIQRRKPIFINEERVDPTGAFSAIQKHVGEKFETRWDEEGNLHITIGAGKKKRSKGRMD